MTQTITKTADPMSTFRDAAPDRPAVARTGPYDARSARASRAMAVWLFIMCGLVALIVTVGGATRLTDSGLSITEWDLIMGTFPPMSDAAWQVELEKYRQIPEYQRVNKGMSLAEFKVIYWWEWGHRNLGRFIGLAYLLPMAFFLWQGFATGALRWKLLGVFGLICAQGALGWYMVSSGLVDRVDVSQYRLAAHLGLAFVIFIIMMWMALRLWQVGSFAVAVPTWPIALFGAALYVQVLLGALVAGLRAGKSYNTWPLMDGEFFPAAYWGVDPRFASLFEEIAAVQFNHRLYAYGLVAGALALWLWLRRQGQGPARFGLAIFLAVTAQMFLGVWTVVAAVPINLGLAHQLGALGILALVLWTLAKAGRR